MLIHIKDDDYLPSGMYALNNPDKINRAKANLGFNPEDRDILIEYDKLGGYVLDTGKGKVPTHTFWNLKQKK